MFCAIMEIEKSASAAAVSFVSLQVNAPEPRTTRTICARKTMKRVASGIDQNIIWRIEESMQLVQRSISPFWKDSASIGNAATAYEMPIIMTVTVSRLNERLNTEME